MTDFLLPGVSVKRIQHLVAEHFHIPVGEMTSPSRRRRVAWPRQLAMSLGCEFTGKSMSEIGKRFGGRNHATVRYAVAIVPHHENANDEFRNACAELRTILDHLKRAC